MRRSVTIKHFIDNQSVSSIESFSVKSSRDGSEIHKVAKANDAIIEQALSSSAKALQSWKHSTLPERKAIFLKASELMRERSNLFMETSSRET